MLFVERKPTASTTELDYLLATPFRYAPRKGGSRFRSTTDSGVFYGAQSVHTACAELGYWRWRFLQDCVDLDRIEPVAHTAFQTTISTTVVDLRAAAFSAGAALSTPPTDYSATQAFAGTARQAELGAIVYLSLPLGLGYQYCGHEFQATLKGYVYGLADVACWSEQRAKNSAAVD